MRQTLRFLGAAALAVAWLTACGTPCGAAGGHAPKKAAKVELPAAVKTAFETAYPKATIKHVSREKESGETRYEVESMDGAQARDLIYRADGTVVEIEEALAPADLPQAVRQAVAAKYPHGRIVKAEKLTRGQTQLYEIRVRAGKKRHEVAIDPAGNLVPRAIPG